MANDANPFASTLPKNGSDDIAFAPTIHRTISTDPTAAPDEHIGRVIEDRYELIRRIGGGASGDVWEADDRIVGERVAVKWMRVARGSMLARSRREITTLRLLRFPGVVRLIDDGVVDEKPFLVMELVDGQPFPGIENGNRASWKTLAGPTLSLLETLAHVHAAGVIHRDLKPENVLVRSDGRPVVLDFGISQIHTAGIERLTDGRQMVGTPLYIAPEQIFGEAVDARADLYAIGVMLYEVLTGHVPHMAADVDSMLRARLLKPARPVQELAPALPVVVAAVVNRLLATRVEDRFESAADVLAALRGESMTANAMLSFLGPREPLLDIVSALENGQSIDLVGPHGSGRTRWLSEIAEMLKERSRAIAWTYASRSPLGTLLPILGEPMGADQMSLERALEWAEVELSRLLSGGTILIVDDVEQVDPWSADVIDRCRPKSGSVIRAFLSPPSNISPDDIVAIPSVDESSLRMLFAGPDRLFHLREDAAQALWERTNGHPAQIEVELLSWTRLGLARRDGSVFIVDRDSLGRILTGFLRVRITPSAGSELDFDDVHAEHALRWLSIAGCPLSLAQLVTLMQCAPFRIEAACLSLVQRGVIKRSANDQFETREHMNVAYDEQERMRAHRAIASVLSPGDDLRLHHLLAAEMMAEAACEAMEVANRQTTIGNIGAAIALLGEGLRAARAVRADAEEKRILIRWSKTALADGTPRAIDRVLYEITRVRSPHPELGRLESLLRAAIAAPGAGSIQAMEIADELGAFSDPELERWRHRVRVAAAAARASPGLIAEVLDEVEEWAEQSEEPLAELSLAEGRARQRYHEGRFEDAAALYARAASLETSTTVRIEAMLRSASALLEAFRHDEAARTAEECRSIAARFRNPHWEGRAEWLLRSAQYRTGQTRGADMELVDTVALVGAQDLEALVCLNEAAAAMRVEMQDTARTLAEHAATIWRGMGRPFATMLARALAIACGATAEAGEVDTLAMRASSCKGAGIGIQTLGLLGKVFPEMRPSWQQAIAGLVSAIPQANWHQRMDVLSVDESLEGAVGRAHA